ncbi:hypothetical protein JXK06_00855 [Patescibacteria group bacterium]|nr:hypothetical protein [Patescibacteria group bacterium]
MKNLKKGIYLGLPLGAALMIILALVFINAFPTALLDNTSITIFLGLLLVIAVVIYKVMSIREVIVTSKSQNNPKFTLSEGTEFMIDYSGKTQLKHPLSEQVKALKWPKSQQKGMFIKKGYLLNPGGDCRGDKVLEFIEANNFVAANLYEGQFYPESLPNGKIIFLGSIAINPENGYEMIPFLGQKNIIQRTWLKSRCFSEDRFLVFKKDEYEGEPILPDEEQRLIDDMRSELL